MPRSSFSSRCPLAWVLFVAVLALTACKANTPQALLASGKAHIANNEPAAAVIQFKSALQIDPSNIEARILLGEALIATHEVDSAIVEFDKALNDKAPAVKVLPALSKALVLAGDFKKLVNTYGDVNLDDASAQAALKSNLASAWGALGDRPRTEASIAAALKAVPDHGPAKVLQARLLAGSGKFDEAASLIDEALARNARYHEAWLLRGEILAAAKSDLKGAEQSYLKALAIEPSYLAAHAALITLRMQQRDIAGLKSQADQLRAVLPKHPYTALVDANLAYMERQYVRARELVQLLLRVYPDNPGALALGGAVEAQLGAVSQAARYFNKALQQNPALDGVRTGLAEVEVRQGQYTKAMDTLKPLLAAQPPVAQALALAGDAALRMGQPEVAERYFREASKRDPGNERLSAAAAVARLNSGDVSAAMADLQQLSSKSKQTYVDELIFAARLKRREYDAALAALDALIAKDPGKASHIGLRGQVYLARRDLPSARKAFEQALAADPANFAAVSSLAEIDVREGKVPQAVARLRASVKSEPGNAVALMTLAYYLARHELGSVDEIKKLYAEAVAAAPTAVEPRLRQIDYAMKQRQFKDALQAAQEGAAAMPWDVSMLDAVGQAQMRAGDPEQAATTFRRLATLLPEAPEPYLRLAELYLANGRRDQAESAILKALDLNPNLSQAQAMLVDIVAGSGSKQGAIDKLKGITRANPKQPLGYILEAGYHVRRKDIDAASAALREGLARTDSPELAARLYSLLMAEKRPAEGDRFGDAWMRQHPKDVGFEYLQANVDISRGNARSAEQRLRRFVAAHPNHVLGLNNLAEVLIRTGGKGAVEYAQRAVDLRPDNAPLLDTLAGALAAEGKYKQALEVQRRAIDLSPTDELLRLGLARVALRAGDKQLARKELERLRSLGTAFPAQVEVATLLKSL